jgi:NADPH:quinone reductase-like Zn-dependent oxidoreductase
VKERRKRIKERMNSHMALPTNRAAWLIKADTPLEVSNAPMPTPGLGELVVHNVAVGMNQVDTWMLEAGVFVKQWPSVIGNDVAGTVYAVGPDLQRFRKGDRVIG